MAPATLAPFTYLKRLNRRRKATPTPSTKPPHGWNEGRNGPQGNSEESVDHVLSIAQPHDDLRAFLLVLGIGVVACALAGYSSLFEQHPVALFYAYMLFATWYGDARISIAALVLTLAACAAIVPRFTSLPVEALIFLVASVVQIWLVGRLRVAFVSLQRARSAQQASEQRLRAVITHAPLLFFTLDRHGTCTFMSGGGFAGGTDSGQSLVGKAVAALFPQSCEPSIRAHFLRALGGEPQSTRETRDGQVYEVRWIPLPEATGEISGVLGVAIDVSDQERARAEAVQLATVRSDFVAAVSHELRTPLTVIIGFAELLHFRWAELSDARRRQGIDKIAAAAERQHRLIMDLLLASHIEAAPVILETRPCYLVTCLERAAAEVRTEYADQHIQLHGTTRPSVLVDPERLQGVLRHLLDNAAKHSPVGAPIDVSWVVDRARVVVRIRDHGQGIPASAQAQLFTRFGRLPGSLSKSGKTGTGLGLYLSREVARAMGGDLLLDSTNADGSTFKLILPVSPAPTASS